MGEIQKHTGIGTIQMTKQWFWRLGWQWQTREVNGHETCFKARKAGQRSKITDPGEKQELRILSPGRREPQKEAAEEKEDYKGTTRDEQGKLGKIVPYRARRVVSGKVFPPLTVPRKSSRQRNKNAPLIQRREVIVNFQTVRKEAAPSRSDERPW